MDTPAENPFDKLSARHKKFVLEYLDCLNASEAYRRAGYSPKDADSNASRLMGNDSIRAAISAEGERLAMSAGEAIVHYTHIARSRLNDYFKIVKVLQTPLVRKPLQQLIDELDTEMAFEDEFAKLAKLSDLELKKHQAEQKERELKGIRYTLELERNPGAYRDVPGEAEWIEREKLDLVALVKDRKLGRIKTYQMTEFGPKVELYSSFEALDKLLQLHGRYKQLPGGTGDRDGKVVYRLPDGTELEF